MNLIKAFAWHEITDTPEAGGTWLTKRKFRFQLEELSSRGIRSITSRGRVGDGREFYLTFDDGYESFYSEAAPLLEEFGFRGVFFVLSDWIGKANRWDYSNRFKSKSHLTLSEIRELVNRGHEVASHGRNHVDFRRLTPNRLKDELSSSKAMLEDITGKKVESVSFPFGRVDRRVAETALEAGYSRLFTMGVPPAELDSMLIGRWGIYCTETKSSFKAKLEESGLKYRYYKQRQATISWFAGGLPLLQRILPEIT